MNAGRESSLAQLLESALPRMRDLACRIAPSSFDPDDAQLLPFPKSTDPAWPSFGAVLNAVHPRAVMACVPFFWQIEPSLHRECRAVPCPLFMSQKQNVPVAAEAIRQIGIEVVVAEAAHADILARAILERAVPLPRTWVLISGMHSPLREIPAILAEDGCTVVHETHLVPGVPILATCATAAHARFVHHPTSNFSWEFDASGASITSAVPMPLPLVRFSVPFRASEASACASCGKPGIDSAL